MPLAKRRRSDLHKLRLAVQRAHILAPQITHARLQAADQLMDVKRKRSFIRDPALNSFRHEFIRIRDVGLPGWLRVSIGTTEECDTFLEVLRKVTS